VSTRTYLSIGDVLSLLRQEFPDITISKIRFLESQGLVDPERSPSGYRKFYEHDVERLRWVLRQQREHFLPLKVIRDRLASNGDRAPDYDDDDSGLEDVVDLDAIEETFGAEHERTRSGAKHAAVDAESEAEFAAPRTGAHQLEEVEPRARREEPLHAHRLEERDEQAARPSAPSRTETLATAAPLAPRSPAVTSQPVRPAAPPPTEAAETPAPVPAPRQPAAAEREKVPARGSAELTGASLTMDELCAASGLAATEVAALEGFGLVEPLVVGGALYYDEDALTVARLVSDFARFGIEPRHLRLFRNAADRELGLIEQVVTPLIRQRNPEARQRAVEASDELSRLGQALRASLLRRSLRHHLGG
jgi:DNA-binding transcriptional MerR regulator